MHERPAAGPADELYAELDRLRDELQQYRDVFDGVPPESVRQLQRDLEDARGDVASLRVATEWQAAQLGSAAHDLQTPLAVIAATIESLQRDAGTMTPDMRRSMLDRVARQTTKLRRLVRHLLRSGSLQVQSGTPSRTTVELQLLVDEVLHTLSPIEHQVTYDFATTQLYCDRSLLERMLYELLGNVLRHAPRGTPVHLGSIDRGVDVELFVEDEGANVPVAERARILAPFDGPASDLDAAEDAGPQLDLGLLSLFARLHGGRAWVTDAEGGGASFRVLVSNALPDTHTEVD